MINITVQVNVSVNYGERLDYSGYIIISLSRFHVSVNYRERLDYSGYIISMSRLMSV